jgi:arsenate reductase
MIVYHYPKCTTCKKALAFLKGHELSFTEKHIVDEKPSKEELRVLIKKYGYPIQKFFNTSGVKYREMGLSKRLKEMSDEEKLGLLASDGMLIKRPIAVKGDQVTVGFKEETYKDVWVKTEA